MPEVLQSKTAGQGLSSTGPEVPERHPDTEEVTGSNPVRPTRHYLLLALPGSALRPCNWPYCQAGRMPRLQTAGTRPVVAAGGRGRLQHRGDARETASAPMGLLAGHRRVDDHLQVAIA